MPGELIPSNLIPSEPALRAVIFLGVFTLLALAEIYAPFRASDTSRTRR